MVKALFDTNILIDYLNRVPDARAELSRYSEKAISAVTWIEVLVGATTANEAATRTYLSTFVLVPLDDTVAERTIQLRRATPLKLPDAIVRASAQVYGGILVTRNTKDFPKGDPAVRMPYTI